ncbi:hypothetical protein D3C85_1461660 [compost metagenome]
MVRRGLSLGHDLNAHAPFRKITTFDRLEQVTLCVIRIGTGQACRICRGQVFDPLLGLVVPFHPVPLAIGVDQAVGVATKAVHVTVTVGNAAVREQNGDLVQRLR